MSDQLRTKAKVAKANLAKGTVPRTSPVDETDIVLSKQIQSNSAIPYSLQCSLLPRVVLGVEWVSFIPPCSTLRAQFAPQTSHAHVEQQVLALW